MSAKPQRSREDLTMRWSERRTAVRSTFLNDFYTFTPSDARPRPPSLILFSLDAKRPVTTWFPLLTYSLPFLRDCVIIIVCLAAYRAVRLPVLPWLAAQYAIAFAAGTVAGQYFHQILPHDTGPGHLPPAPLLSLALIAGFIADLSVFLAVVLILSEVAVLIGRAYSDVRSPILQFFVRIHTYIHPIGATAIVLALLEPLLPVIYYYSHPHT